MTRWGRSGTVLSDGGCLNESGLNERESHMQIFPGVDVDEEHLNSYFNLYRHLHRHPELSMQEFNTAELIRQRLIAAGAETFVCGGTGVVGILRNGPGPVIAFRADIDGLPIEEETGLPYASTDTAGMTGQAPVPVMHGCGHDTHITAGIAAAELLADHRPLWAGTVVFVFQPGEETAAGAAAMVSDGLWEKAPVPEVVLGQHVAPFEAGTIRTTGGPAMSLADSWRVVVHGQGAHGSQPENSIDPIVTAAYMITRLQTVVSRELSPLASAVVTVGTFHAGLKENIIPAEAVFTLNIRSPNDEVRTAVLAGVRRVINAEAAAAGAGEPTITELYRFPRCYNDPQQTERVLDAFAVALGESNVERHKPQSMGSEDIGWLGDSIGVATVFWWFGAYRAEKLTAAGSLPGNHSPFFGPDLEPALSGGIRSALAGIMCYLAVDAVRGKTEADKVRDER